MSVLRFPGRPTPDAGDALAVASQDPMRHLRDRRCDACRHAWAQPSPEGDCPRCGSGRTRTLMIERVCVADRL